MHCNDKFLKPLGMSVCVTSMCVCFYENTGSLWLWLSLGRKCISKLTFWIFTWSSSTSNSGWEEVNNGLLCEGPISVSFSSLRVQWHLALEFYALVFYALVCTTIKLPFLVVLFTLNDTPVHSSRIFCERELSTLAIQSQGFQ